MPSSALLAHSLQMQWSYSTVNLIELLDDLEARQPQSADAMYEVDAGR